ncbi:STAS domain-containing protein [Amycolatopsis jiangsuensis]|uniref:Anti-anti-sigma factor n=1 Tax=Amycolatopsis jiangsuensis TaxID=1181879 RepID=A0A840IPL9_9PSEU|nr:STAS domain-containing protein [Amycolatopsis jiangsuensis]MBB4684326.1 anti-anti-sigma factor [Amycolatopsis jiangsuensis]
MTTPFTAHSAPAHLTVTTDRRGAAVVIAPVGDVDAATAPALEAAAAAVDPSEAVVIDLSQVGFLSCAGVRALLAASERLPSLTVVTGPARTVRRCIEMADAGSVLRVRETLVDAVPVA